MYIIKYIKNLAILKLTPRKLPQLTQYVGVTNKYNKKLGVVLWTKISNEKTRLF